MNITLALRLYGKTGVANIVLKDMGAQPF